MQPGSGCASCHRPRSGRKGPYRIWDPNPVAACLASASCLLATSRCRGGGHGIFSPPLARHAQENFAQAQTSALLRHLICSVSLSQRSRRHFDASLICGGLRAERARGLSIASPLTSALDEIDWQGAGNKVLHRFARDSSGLRTGETDRMRCLTVVREHGAMRPHRSWA